MASKQSFVSMKKHSTLTRGSTTQNVKDTRDLKNREVQSRMIDDLILFIVDNNLKISPHMSLEKKAWRLPNSKTVYSAFECFFSLHKPGFTLAPKKETDEIIHILKVLDYPFPLSKSQLQTPGASHAWPNVLGSIDWLRELTQVNILNNEVEKALNKNVSEVIMRLKWCNTNFSAWLCSGDVLDRCDEELREGTMKLYNVSSNSINSQYPAKFAELSKLLDTVTKHPETKVVLKTQLSEAESSIKQLSNEIREPDKLQEIADTKLIHLQRDLEEMQGKEKAVDIAIEDSSSRLKEQSQRGIDFMKMVNQRESIINDLQEAEKIQEQGAAHLKNLQQSKAKQNVMIKSPKDNYNALIAKYKKELTPLTSNEFFQSQEIIKKNLEMILKEIITKIKKISLEMNQKKDYRSEILVKETELEKREYDLYVSKEILDNIVSGIKTFLQNNLQKYKLSSGELSETHQEVDLASKRYSNLIKRRVEDQEKRDILSNKLTDIQKIFNEEQILCKKNSDELQKKLAGKYIARQKQIMREEHDVKMKEMREAHAATKLQIASDFTEKKMDVLRQNKK